MSHRLRRISPSRYHAKRLATLSNASLRSSIDFKRIKTTESEFDGLLEAAQDAIQNIVRETTVERNRSVVLCFRLGAGHGATGGDF